MKKTLLFSLLFVGTAGFSQQLEVSAKQLDNFTIYDLMRNTNHDRTVTCAADTVLYCSAKATASSGLSINNATSAYAVSQYFDCPQAMNIEGAQFIGVKSDANGGINIDVTVEIYAAGADSMPTGAALATQIINIDTNFYGGNIAMLTRTVTFGTPVAVTTPYVVVVENNSANAITLFASSYTAGDGGMEWLGSANLFGTWTRSYNLVVMGTPYDADMLLHPIVNYDITNDFTFTPDCGTPGIISYDVTNSAIMSNRMYSSATYFGAETDQYNWDWGDGSALDHVLDTTHDFTTAGPFDVVYTDSLFGWTTICSDTTVWSTCLNPSSGASIEQASANLTIYPNPATEHLVVKSDAALKSVEMFDISGKLILSQKLMGTKQQTIDISKVSAGTYVIKIKLEDGNIYNERIEVK